jgi:nuclear transcription Y subunit beta
LDDSLASRILPGELTTENDHSDGSCGASGSDVRSGKMLRDQDRFLPIANIARIMKNVLPRNGKIAKEAKECVQECVSEFVSFITSEASDKCYQEKRKTINGEDIIFAMATLGFDNYIEPLKVYLQKYRDVRFSKSKFTVLTFCILITLTISSFTDRQSIKIDRTTSVGPNSFLNSSSDISNTSNGDSIYVQTPNKLNFHL